MSRFEINFMLGFDHITAWEGLDHILFLIALTAIYQFKHWGRVLGVVTAFTVGHTVTIILANTGAVSVNGPIVEFLIPVTIMLTGIVNLMKVGQDPRSNGRFFIAALFGLIHGLGFFRSFRMLTVGDSDGWSSLLPFTLGIELGQLLIVFILLLITAILFNFMRLKQREWNLFSSGIVCGVAGLLMIETWPW
ncbi:HupE/UreJ family protein [Phaeocystidibacter luteus]|uniref:HupE/UreJ family protein n=1 Tax=Phaeocystidibacter luteus TaxID=911197 RepID=A0A6N6REK0_9FLAO|nr:HupE/UreJ family protein [Phaeocystidibacter luteus]KAB2808081.1 HupE/UreJ family protein [Phaeocystidibacter luteus]